MEDGGLIKGIRVPGRASYSRKQLDDLRGFVQDQGKGADLSWVKVTTEGMKSSLPKAVGEKELEAVKELQPSLRRTTFFLMLGGHPGERSPDPGPSARTVGPPGEIRFRKKTTLSLWVYDFPLLEWNEQEKRYFGLPSSLHLPPG